MRTESFIGKVYILKAKGLNYTFGCIIYLYSLWIELSISYSILVTEADLGLLQYPRWSFQPLTTITKCSIWDVAAVLDPPLSAKHTICRIKLTTCGITSVISNICEY